MFNWRSKDEFWRWLDTLPKTLGSEPRRLETLAIVSLTEQQLRTLAPLPPAETPRDESDFPGPVLRWYGDAGGSPVILTHHWGHSWGDYTDLTIDHPRSGAPPWTALEPLIAHAPELVGRVSWVRFADGPAEVAVRAVGPGATQYSVYETTSITDARAMVSCISRVAGEWEYELAHPPRRSDAGEFQG